MHYLFDGHKRAADGEPKIGNERLALYELRAQNLVGALRNGYIIGEDRDLFESAVPVYKVPGRLPSESLAGSPGVPLASSRRRTPDGR